MNWILIIIPKIFGKQSTNFSKTPVHLIQSLFLQLVDWIN